MERLTFMDRVRAIALLWREAWRRGFRRKVEVELTPRVLTPIEGRPGRELVEEKRALNRARAEAVVERVRTKLADRRPSVFVASDRTRYRRVNADGTFMREDVNRPKGKKAVKVAKRARRVKR